MLLILMFHENIKSSVSKIHFTKFSCSVSYNCCQAVTAGGLRPSRRRRKAAHFWIKSMVEGRKGEQRRDGIYLLSRLCPEGGCMSEKRVLALSPMPSPRKLPPKLPLPTHMQLHQ
jgi:hypothetical protein